MSKDPELQREKKNEAARRRRKENPDHHRAIRRAYYQRHAAEIAERNLVKRAAKREHAVARTKVQRAIAAGELVRGPCEIGDDCFGAIEAHHDDYSKPLEVRWICKSHHMRMHAQEQKTWAERGII